MTPEAQAALDTVRAFIGADWPEDTVGYEFRAPSLEALGVLRREFEQLDGRADRLAEAIGSALTSLATGAGRDGYAYSVLEAALAGARQPRFGEPEARGGPVVSATEQNVVRTVAACGPSREDILTRMREQRVMFDAGNRERRAGNTEAARLIYQAAEAHWDDAIHIADPANHALSLCGSPYRNLVDISGEWPDSWSGCWGCLSRASKLREEEARTNPGELP